MSDLNLLLNLPLIGISAFKVLASRPPGTAKTDALASADAVKIKASRQV
jgi:hypothetical protein